MVLVGSILWCYNGRFGPKTQIEIYTLQGWINCATATQLENYLLVQNMLTRCWWIFWEIIWSDTRVMQPDTLCSKVLQWQALLLWDIINCINDRWFSLTLLLMRIGIHGSNCLCMGKVQNGVFTFLTPSFFFLRASCLVWAPLWPTKMYHSGSGETFEIWEPCMCKSG